ncbi:MAG TPA: glycosyltransferase family 39 protein [Acidimicrobiales bacterium]|nr:glycosyltransferase family 39 protein [Acidimicrobiales bacterium]
MTGGGAHAERRVWAQVPSWWRWLGLWTVVGLVIRIATVLGRPHRTPGGDSAWYHGVANLLVDGRGFIDPFIYQDTHRVVQSAQFPPGFMFVLAAASLVGLKSYFAHRIWCCVIGAAAITVSGLVGREIAGPRAGLIAAGVVAVYPNVWMSDEVAFSECISPLMVGLVLLTAYRFWKQPGYRRAAWLGLAVGLATLVRDELALLGLFIVVPLALTARGLAWRRRATALLLGGAVALGVIAPWVGYNMSRFKEPVFISAGLGITLASTNCAHVYSGSFEGYWDLNCSAAAPVDPTADESVQSSQAQKYATHFIRTHESRLPVVVAARLGRAFGLYHPLQQITLDSNVETRPYHWALTGLGMYYVLVVLAAGGVVVLRRRRVPVFPLLAVGLTVAVSVALAFGDTRYRSTFEPVLAMLAAVLLDRAWTRWRGPVPDRAADGDHPAPEPVLAAPGR